MDAYKDIPYLPPLWNAVNYKDIQRVTRLLEEGAAPNYTPDDLSAPLQVAAGHGSLEIMDLLLKYGADINAKNVPEGKAALTRATIQGKYDAVVFLVERGADINTCCSYGTTAFGGASFNMRKAIMYYLVRKGVNITNDLSKCFIESYEHRNLLTMGILHHFGADESVLKSRHVKEILKTAQRYYNCYDSMITFILCFKQVYQSKDVGKLIAKELWKLYMLSPTVII